MAREDKELEALSMDWLARITRSRYVYGLTWLGRHIIQLPQDIMAIQEIIWKTKPDLVVETGIAHGGSLVLSASMLELIGGKGKVVGVDVDIRRHTRKGIKAHPLHRRIKMIEGSSIDDRVVREVRKCAKGKKRVMVILDSNHTHAHVLRELEAYSQLVTKGCYLVVFDTIIEDFPPDLYPGREFGVGNSPKTALLAFLKKNRRFRIDRDIAERMLLTAAPDGYLKCVRD